MTLPDGTQLWLNAASSIRFPSAFTGGTRQVDITGEAYLEVAKDASKPFIVNVNDASIQVLGTHFNVMAYNNEEALKTTLLEGSVRFSKGKEHVLLKPGQQGSLQQNGSIQLSSDVDVQSVTAWKDGMQSFNSADIQTIMRQVERWYDVDITYSGTMPAITFSGEIPRTANLSEVLKLFKASNIHFEIDKTMKKMTVSP
jgi:ferric-dicitrate binding protein FerR (iron transport regulator)